MVPLPLKGFLFAQGKSGGYHPQPLSRTQKEELYSLRGKPIRYLEPFESVAENDWEVLR